MTILFRRLYPGLLVRASILALLALTVSACTGVPQGIQPVTNFDIQRYQGQWYEIARLDNRFEKGMEAITANYSLRDDGGVEVLNRGYLVEEKSWRSAMGKAYFIDDSSVGHLKVSFFGPFYSSYIVFGLDHDDYEYAFVTSSDKSYLWLLARKPYVSDAVRQQFVTQSRRLGFDTDELIFVNHETESI